MKIKWNLLAAVSCVALIASPALAGEQDDKLIEKVVAAYGGEALTKAKSLTVNSTILNVSNGQSADPAETNIANSKIRLTIDFENSRKSFENWNKNRGGTFLNQAIFDGETGYAINHGAKTTGVNQNLTFGVIGGGTMRSTDTALVTILLENRENAAVGDSVKYKNRMHETITFPMEGSPDLTIYVDAESGLISKMTRENPVVGTLRYVFTDHQMNEGVVFARQTTFLVAGQPTTLTVDRSISLNGDIADAFVVPGDYQEQGANIDTSEMMVRELADGIFYVGQNAGFSIFVDAGDHFVASGGYAGLTARFDAMKEATGINKRLGQQVVTHQHSDHVGGLAEAATLGAQFVTVAEHLGVVQAQFSAPLPEDRFDLVQGKTSLAGGRVEVYDISTAHAANYLLVYLPEIDLVFSADHFSTNLEQGLPVANNNMVTFRAAVEALDLEIDSFLGAHGTRPLTMQDLRAATDGYRDVNCPGNRPICS